jgi:hypothetical protein
MIDARAPNRRDVGFLVVRDLAVRSAPGCLDIQSVLRAGVGGDVGHFGTTRSSPDAGDAAVLERERRSADDVGERRVGIRSTRIPNCVLFLATIVPP